MAYNIDPNKVIPKSLDKLSEKKIKSRIKWERLRRLGNKKLSHKTITDEGIVQLLRDKIANITALIEPDRIEFPGVEVDQRSGLNEIPIRPALRHKVASLSDRAYMEWMAWVGRGATDIILSDEEKELLTKLQAELAELELEAKERSALQAQLSESMFPNSEHPHLPDPRPIDPFSYSMQALDREIAQLEKHDRFQRRMETFERRQPTYDPKEEKKKWEFEGETEIGSKHSPRSRMFNAVIQASWQAKVKSGWQKFEKVFYPQRVWDKKLNVMHNDYVNNPIHIRARIMGSYPSAKDLRIEVVKAKFEADVRVSEGKIPNPTNWRPMDLRFRKGQQILELLAEYPERFRVKEFVHNSRPYKVVYIVGKSQCYWIYCHPDYNEKEILPAYKEQVDEAHLIWNIHQKLVSEKKVLLGKALKEGWKLVRWERYGLSPSLQRFYFEK